MMATPNNFSWYGMFAICCMILASVMQRTKFFIASTDPSASELQNRNGERTLKKAETETETKYSKKFHWHNKKNFTTTRLNKAPKRRSPKVVSSFLEDLTKDKFADTPGSLLLQILAINQKRETPLYSPDDVKLIMNAVAISTLSMAHGLHMTERSIVQHNFGAASCQLLSGATAAEVAFAAVHTFWYGSKWTSDLSTEEFRQVRASLANAIGEEAEALLWRYSHIFIHGQNPRVLQYHVDEILKKNQSTTMDDKLYRFIICDEFELVRLKDRIWFAEDADVMWSRLRVLQQIGFYANFPRPLLKVFTDESEDMLKILRDNEAHIQWYKGLWHDSTPLVHHWQVPSQMSHVLGAQDYNTSLFMTDYKSQTEKIDAFLKPQNIERYDLKQLEADFRRMALWQYELASSWHTEMLFTGREGGNEGGNEAKTSLEDLYIDRLTKIVRRKES